MSKTAAYKVLYEQLKEKITNSTYKKRRFFTARTCSLRNVSGQSHDGSKSCTGISEGWSCHRPSGKRHTGM